MPITIKEIIASDTISQLVDKTNFNFDQLLLNGGGPAGPAGPIGPTGPAGGRGPKGSTWYEDTSTTAPGVSPNVAPPTTTPLSGDYYLQFNGQVWEYNGNTWVITTIDLQGPVGPQGASGGFGLTFGSPSIGLSTAIYNGPIGEGNGATGGVGGNEGVPSIMIGGAVSTTPPLGTIPLTNAYIIPNAIAQGLISTTASLLVHQKDSTARSIIFHGGAANASDKYTQTDIGNLSGISIGVDDRLVLNVPKIATTPASQNELIGFEVNIPTRSHQYTAGKAINFQTGTRNVQDLAGENSDFIINVGAGSNAAGNKFGVQTAGTTNSTLIQSGGGFPVNLAQNAQVGVTQIQAGLINLTSSVNENIQLNSGGQIKLDTTQGSNPAGTISLNSGTGGITAIANDGAITIRQSNAGPTIVKDIIIENLSTAGHSLSGGDIYIRTNSQTILRKSTASAKDAPSIVLDYTSSNPEPHTRFVGKQTWGALGLSSGVFPSAGSSIFKDPESTITTVNSIFELTGTSGNIDYFPGSILQGWTGGTQSTSGVAAGFPMVVLGNESGNGALPGGTFNITANNSLGFAIRNSTNTEEYFNANSQMTAFGKSKVERRAFDLNSDKNFLPRTSLIASSSSSANDNNSVLYGWNTTNANAHTSEDLGMPTSQEIAASPAIVQLYFGPSTTAGGPLPGSGSRDTQVVVYNLDFKFPIGYYPGQRLTLMCRHWSESYFLQDMSGQLTNYAAYGNIQIKIPNWRRRSTNVGNGSWSSWWADAGSQGSFLQPASYRQVQSSITSSEAGYGKIETFTLDLIWDGTITTQRGSNTGLANAPQMNTEIQWGWRTIASTFDQGAYINYDPPGQVCFAYGDLVEMFNGTMKAINEIRKGDEVKSIKNGKVVKGIVTDTLIHPTNDVVEVVKINGITADPYHPVYVDGKWIPIKELGNVTTEFIGDWYNLEIDGHTDDSEHNYIIGNLIASGLGDNERLNAKYQRQPKELLTNILT